MYYDFECTIASEGIGTSIKNGIMKIFNGILWLIDKVRDLIQRLISSIKSILHRSKAVSTSSTINSAVREYRTIISKHIQTEENLDISTIPGLSTYDPANKKQSESVSEDEANAGERVLVHILENIENIITDIFKGVTSTMENVLRRDSIILPYEIQFVNKIKSLSADLLTLKKLNSADVDIVRDLCEDISDESESCHAVIENYQQTKKSYDKEKYELMNPMKELPQTVTRVISAIIKARTMDMISTIKTETPNFQNLVQKIEAHAESYKKSADCLKTVVTDIKNYVKTGKTLNSETPKIFGYIEKVVKANLILNNAYGKILNTARLTSL